MVAFPHSMTDDDTVAVPVAKPKAKAKAKGGGADIRHYSVTHVPYPTIGIGVYSGPFPDIWDKILLQGHNHDGNSLCGSGIRLSRHHTFDEAIDRFKADHADLEFIPVFSWQRR